MNPQQGTENPEAKQTQSLPRSRLAIQLSSSVFFIAAVVLLGALLKPAKTAPLVWFSGPPVRSATKPSTWGKIRFQVIKLTYPVWKHFQRPAPNISINGNLFIISTAMARSLTEILGRPASTNAQGFRAWIAQPETVKRLRENLNEHSGGDIPEGDARVLATARVATSSGRRAMVFMGGQGSDQFIVELSPAVVSKTIRLELGNQWTPSNAPPAMGAKCRAVLPNGGGLIIEGATSGNKPNQSYLEIFSATAIDPRGNPVKL